MDFDVMGKHIHSLLAFKDRLEGMMNGADSNAGRASDTLDELMSFKSSVEAAMPDIQKMIVDASAFADDIGAIKKDLAPVLEWVAERQKKDDELKAAWQAANTAPDTPKHDGADGEDTADKPEGETEPSAG